MEANSSNEITLLVSANPMSINLRLTITQVIMWPFIYINLFMIYTFARREAFRTETRYILFAQTLVVDLIFLLVTNFVVLMSFKYVLMPVWFCIPLCMLMEVVRICTPFTITAMCLERYVAICMPLRHEAISTTSRAFLMLLLIWILSSILTFVDFFILTATVSKDYYVELILCHYVIMTPYEWTRLVGGVLCICVFVFIFLVELFCYVMIVLAARAASGDNKKLASKAQRTLLLHLLQLFLCSAENICPYYERVIIEIELQLYLSIRFFNFITFNIISRAVSPLVYGLRDEKFYAALFYSAKCKINHLSSKS